ncbi:hypothetical protein NKI56_21265 [Mesorhizobium sp. M0622]|uniref:hypothetical protein n=1 Tax=unclassified Mesorhizobium TaxID=325217 RepID=UPI003338362D
MSAISSFLGLAEPRAIDQPFEEGLQTKIWVREQVHVGRYVPLDHHLGQPNVLGDSIAGSDPGLPAGSWRLPGYLSLAVRGCAYVKGFDRI